MKGREKGLGRGLDALFMGEMGGDAFDEAVGGKRLAQRVDVVGGKGRAQQAVDLGQVGLHELGLGVGLKCSLQRCARGVEQNLGARLLGNLDQLPVGFLQKADSLRHPFIGQYLQKCKACLFFQHPVNINRIEIKGLGECV